jgi:hypothetical protein
MRDHPYRPLYVVRDAQPPSPRGELRAAFGVLIAVSAIQIVSGAQVIAGVLGLAGGAAGLLSTRRSRWKTSCSSS